MYSIVLALLLAAPPATRLGDLLREAREQNPELQSARSRARAAEAQVGPAGALPDDALEQALNQLASAPIPSIALVHGPAFGAGCDLACACDLRVGSDAALFCMPPARLGVVYAART